MTTEEIIKGLESVKTECGKHLDEGFAWICKPIDEAIEVLKREPSTDAISRSKAIEETLKYRMTSGVTNQGTWNECVDVIARTLAYSDTLPTVTPEIPKGEWKYTDEVHEIARCSKCRFLIDASGCVDPEEYISIYRYCPNCGTDMRGVSGCSEENNAE